MWLLILIISVLVVIFFIRSFLKNKVDTITAFTGGLGSGKTAKSVQISIKLFKKNKFKVKIHNLFKKDKEELPKLYSNIPVFIDKKNGYSCKLTEDIVLLRERIPKKSVVLIDEIGGFASQFDYNNPNIKDNFDEFVRLFRHYTFGGYLVVNDQCSENIVLQVRRRINVVQNLSKFVVIPIFHFVFYFVREISISEEIKQVLNDDDSLNNSNKLVFGWWFLFFRKKYKHYDTYCYSERYNRVPKIVIDSLYSENLKQNDLFKCSSLKKEKFTEKKEVRKDA